MNTAPIVLQPHARAFLDAVAALGEPKFAHMPVAVARKLMNEGMVRIGGRAEDVARVEAATARGPHGDIPLRVYVPQAVAPFGVVVFYHGGGFVIGGLDEYDATVRRLVNASGCLVVSVDYRLAPEYAFPVQVDEAYAALAWVAEHAPEFGGDPTRLAVAGDSAGGFMAATAALLARDRGTPKVDFAALIYPKVDAAGSYASHARYAQGYYLSADLMQWFGSALHPTEATKSAPYASPLRESLEGFPPTAIVLAECDPLHDEGIAFGKALEAAGVPVATRVFPGVIHGFYSIGVAFPEAREAARYLGDALRAAIGTKA